MYRYAAAGVGFVGLNFVLGQAPQYGQGRNIFHSKPGQVRTYSLAITSYCNNAILS